MPKKPPPEKDPNAGKKPPKHLKEPNPGPCPAPSNCSCVWTALDYQWIRGANAECTVHKGK